MKIPSEKDQAKQERMDFNQIWLRYVVYWPYFVLLLVLAIAGAWLYLQLVTPLYEATSRILIKDEAKGAEETKGIDFLNMVNTTKLIENESEVISSKDLIVNVVKELHLYAQVYEENRFKEISAYIKSPVKIEVKDPELLSEGAKTYFSFDKNKNEVRINGIDYPLNSWLKIGQDSLRFTLNQRHNGDYSSSYFYKLVHPAAFVWHIKDNLEVTATSKASTILNLMLKDEVPERAEDILNGLMNAYNKSQLYNKNSLAANTLYFLNERLTRVELELDSTENKIKQYKENTGSIDISAEGELFLRNVSDNDQKISEINMQLAVLRQVDDYVLEKNNNSGIVPSTLGVNDPILSNLLNLLYNAELEYEKLKNTEGLNSAPLLSITNQIAKIRPSILENIRSQRKTLEARKANIQSTNNSYSSAIRTIPHREKQLVDINRERSIISGIYTFLLQKREDLALSHAAYLPNTTIVEKADASGNPVSPKPKKVYIIALAFPFLAGIATITFKETFTSKVIFRHEIESMLSYPVIGEIIHNKTMAPIVAGKNKRTFIAEQFRQLRVTMTLKKDKIDVKRILVTSSIAGEGKSFIALNLALTFALTGKKVVIIELDINNPSISNKLDIPRSPGIADYLQDKCNIDGIIFPYQNMPSLFIIPAGRYPENHFTELLENGKISGLIRHLNDNFDYVIIDTAPVSSITDAYLLSSSCDATLYVVRHKYTPKVFLQHLDQNEQLKNVAIVFNDIHARGYGKFQYGYGYGYGYAYGGRSSKYENTEV